MDFGIYQILSISVGLLFVYFYWTNAAFRYYAKIIYFHTNMMLVSTIIVIPYASFRPRDTSNIWPFQRWWAFSFQKIGMKIKKRNTEAFENINEPAILLVNHQSNLDMIGIFHVSPYRSTFLAKKEILYAGFFGLAAWLSGIIFIDRSNPDKAKQTLLDTVKTILDRKVRLWVFPEGTRNMNGSLLPFKKGAFHIAVQAQVPICPVVFSSYRHFMDPEKKIFNPGTIIASAIPPIPTKGLTASDVPELTEKVRNLMLAEFKKITQEVQEDAKARNESLL